MSYAIVEVVYGTTCLDPEEVFSEEEEEEYNRIMGLLEPLSIHSEYSSGGQSINWIGFPLTGLKSYHNENWYTLEHQVDQAYQSLVKTKEIEALEKKLEAIPGWLLAALEIKPLSTITIWSDS